MRKELISMHPSTPLVMNLKNKNYLRLMFGNEENMAQEFAKVDILKVRKDIQTKTVKKFFISRKSHTILRDDNFLDKINIAFENQCKYV